MCTGAVYGLKYMYMKTWLKRLLIGAETFEMSAIKIIKIPPQAVDPPVP